MKPLLLSFLLLGCSTTPEPVPDIFSPEAHQGAPEPYRPIECTVWTYGYRPPAVVDGPRYVVPPDEQGYEAGDVADVDYTDVRYPPVSDRVCTDPR